MNICPENLEIRNVDEFARAMRQLTLLKMDSMKNAPTQEILEKFICASVFCYVREDIRNAFLLGHRTIDLAKDARILVEFQPMGGGIYKAVLDRTETTEK